MEKKDLRLFILAILLIIIAVLFSNFQYKKAVNSCVEHGNEKAYCERVLK